MKKALPLVMLFVLSCVTTLWAQPKPGDKAPEVSLPDLNGKIQKLSDLKGKIVLVDFWASWCAPCRRSNRELKPLYLKYKEKGFEIFGISLDQESGAWKDAVKTDGIMWKQVTEAGGWNAPVALKWNIEQLPSSFLVDKNGIVIAINPSKDEIEKQLKNSTR